MDVVVVLLDGVRIYEQVVEIDLDKSSDTVSEHPVHESLKRQRAIAVSLL